MPRLPDPAAPGTPRAPRRILRRILRRVHGHLAVLYFRPCGALGNPGRRRDPPRRAFRGRPAGGRRPRHADLGRGFRPGRGSCPLGVGPACRAIGTDAAVAASETFVAAAKANASACSSLARPTVQRPDHHRRRLRGRPPISDPNDQLKT